MFNLFITSIRSNQKGCYWIQMRTRDEYILKQVMTGGNFGHYDERLQHGDGKLGALKQC